MGEIFSIIGLVCGFLVTIIGVYRDKMTETIFGIFIICFNVFTLTLHLKETNQEEPKAIDVYRGKTTLQVTYKDSVALDSVVVWKEKN